MDYLSIPIYVSPAIAAREGSPKYGAFNWTFTETQLGELSDRERSEIVEKNHFEPGASGAYQSAFHLDTARVDWISVRDAIRAASAAREAYEAKRKAEDEKAIAECLDKPLDLWISSTALGQMPKAIVPSPASPTHARDPRIAAKLREAEALAETLAHAWREEAVRVFCEAPIASRSVEIPRVPNEVSNDPRVRARLDEHYKVIQLADDLRATSLRQASADLTSFALKIPDLARAAAMGYDVENAVLDHVAESLAASLAAAGLTVTATIADGTPDWDRFGWAERTAPRQAAFDVYDRVVATVSKIEKPSCVTTDVDRIMRITETKAVDDYDDEKVKARYTGVLVSLESPVTKTRVVVVRAEDDSAGAA